MNASSWADRIKSANNIRFPPKQMVWWWSWSSENNEYSHAMLIGPMPWSVHTLHFPPKKEVLWWDWCSFLHDESTHVKVLGPMRQIDYVNCCWRSAENAWDQIKPTANTKRYRL